MTLTEIELLRDLTEIQRDTYMKIAIEFYKKAMKEQTLLEYYSNQLSVRLSSGKENRTPRQLTEVMDEAIKDALEFCNNNRTQAAKHLGLSRRALLRRIEKLENIEKKEKSKPKLAENVVPIKRGRGRPKGSKNKPKEEIIQNDTQGT